MTILEACGGEFGAHGIGTISAGASTRHASLSALRWIGSLAETSSIEQKEH